MVCVCVCVHTKGVSHTIQIYCRACEADEALYTAFNLSVLFDVRTEILNTSEVTSTAHIRTAYVSVCVCVCVCVRVCRYLMN